MEFHAETGNCYSIIDLGDNLQTALVLSGSPTGFMEVAVDLGEMHTLMTIDYEHIVKLTTIDYEPLEGDAFIAEEEIQYYPGDIDDPNERGKTFDATEEYGLSTRMINYFFTATGLNSSYQSRTAYDSRITVAPTPRPTRRRLPIRATTLRISRFRARFSGMIRQPLPKRGKNFITIP